ncbi:MAG: NmrA family NAD(P)-binding protein [Caldilineaceae bacterium]
MILVTGASGKTGRAVIAALAARGERVRALVHRAEAVATVAAAGAAETMVGDMQVVDDLRAACRGVAAVYHICPNMHTGEVAMAEALLGAMADAGVGRLVYHSVLHPQVEAMPHHWRKLRVEELLFTQGVRWTVLQPAAYMQNVFSYWRAIVEEGVFRVPYAVTARLGMVDLEDVAAAAAAVLLDSGHEYAIYELAGREILDQVQVAAVLAQQLGRPVLAEAIDRGEWAEAARRAGQSPEAVDTLRQMFEYYERYGFYGNPSVLRALLACEPSTFAQAVARQVALTSSV